MTCPKLEICEKKVLWHDYKIFCTGPAYECCADSETSVKIYLKKLPREWKTLEIERPLVTVAIPVIARVPLAKKCIISVLEQCKDIPIIIKVFINPRLQSFVNWCKAKGLIVVEQLTFPAPHGKKIMLDNCDTKYIFQLNDDFVLQQSIKPMVDFMENNPDVGVCASTIISKRHATVRHGARMVLTEDRRLIITPCEPKDDYYFCEYVHNGATLFRMKVFNDIKIDLNYFAGYGHEDMFLQLMNTNWKIVHFNKIKVLDISERRAVPRWYRLFRGFGKHESRRYFRRKWRLR